uniref:Tachylectin 2 domain-containing protein n=1 Tax=Leptobrachium leishanense TaxID=445787 RepID=A0A8C5Q1B5_9ANUR
MPSEANQDWFSTAKRVGKSGWEKLKFLLFDPKGLLYVVTMEGKLYKGPAPCNENVPWLKWQATLVGTTGWNVFDSLFFDLKGTLYAVIDDKLVMRSPPTQPLNNWLSTNTTIGNGGWRILTHFMAVSPDGDLWCVNSSNGNLYKGPIPTNDDINYLEQAEILGIGYNMYPLMSFTVDKTMENIVSCEFLLDSSKILSKSTAVVQTQTYKNNSSNLLRHNFSFVKTLTQTSTFSLERGFTVAFGADMSFAEGIPFVDETKDKISIDLSTIHNWNFIQENEIPTSFSFSTDVEVPFGHAVCMIASVTKGEIAVPYRMVIRTLFGYQTTIYGTWRGITYYNLLVTQDDYTP